jgi:hypothetical protein
MKQKPATVDRQRLESAASRRTQNLAAKRAQRERDAAAGYVPCQVKLPKAVAEKLRAALRMPGFENALGDFLDHSIVEVARYPQLAFLLWNRRDRFLPAAEAFALYEHNWRWIDEKKLTAEERDLIDRLKNTFGHGVINA